MQDVPNPNPSIGTSPSTDPASFAFSLDELASENFDVIQWINTSLQCISSANPDGVETDAELEGRITNLYGRLHSYSQEVASSVDDTITQALVRLPRTGLEVGRMVTEVQQLQQALCKIREEAQPAVEMISKPYVAQLNDLKKTQKKLMRCSETLKKASEVDSNMKQLDDIMEKLRVSVSEVDIDLVAVSIREVRQNLADLQKLEVTFGGKQLEAVERHEQLLQRVVETECMEQLRRRVVDRAAHLLKVLDTIGRADAVLQQFSAESIASEKEKVFCLLHHSESKVSRHPISPVRAAEVLKTQLIPSLGCALTDQLDYLMQLAHVYSGNRDITDNAEISEGPESQPVKVLRLMADEIVECLSTCLTPILQCVERNPELISCFEAVRQLSIKIDSTPPKVCVGAEDGRNVKNSLCRRDDIAEQINFYTQTELAHIFEQPKVLESFARREAERVEDLLKDSQSIMKYDRFQVVMNGLMEAVKAVLQFFPDKTLPICVSRWKVALVQSLSFCNRLELFEKHSGCS
ncbi:Golgi complex component 7 (COG7) [Trypanosoma brucei equiperdum]|uniref:Conserved oligomeric Golgi complex subunit 7 n=1 Tax=Trypanosoma brucei equiperdum TaxID=630700 RepID=A0A3L6L4P4_9TRYP|nr:Golgi complex component 7 (COG7) [Trypanosoma brucei equiperdum]